MEKTLTLEQFHDSYNYRLKNRQEFKKYSKISEKFVYEFENIDRKKFLVHVDLYILKKTKIKIYALKFFLKKHKNLKSKKFEKILNLPDSRMIFKTCAQILIDKYEEDTNVGFIVHGVTTQEDVTIKIKNHIRLRGAETSRRFRIYRLLAARYFSSQQFHYAQDESLNTIVVFPKIFNYDKTISDIENTFLSHYPTCNEIFCLPEPINLN